MKKRRALILLGGTWHDFDGFVRALAPRLEGDGWEVESSYDLGRLTRLEREAIDLVLTYTCFSLPAKGVAPVGAGKMEDDQIESLADWVRDGGGLLAAHASTSLGASSSALGHLIGGMFVEHPPRMTFTVTPLYGDHQLVRDIQAFEVFDELYFEHCEPEVEIQMVSLHAGTAYPLVWSKAEGRGRVAHVALGHSAEVWELEPYRRLMLQAAAWAAERN